RKPVAGISELRAEAEQVPLNVLDLGGEVLVDARSADEPEPRVQFVDFPVRVDPRVVFSHPSAVEQRSVAGIARAGVDFHRGIIRKMGKRPIGPLPSSAERRRFRTRLLAWYRRHGRDLPWRRTDDPYHILVSEIMLQQTQVDRVLPKYAEWLQKYPSLDALA